MINRYRKGVKLERFLVNKARKEGLISFRSAGSHSPIDLITINDKEKKIELIQCKTGVLSTKDKKEIEDFLNALKGDYKVNAFLVHKP